MMTTILLSSAGRRVSLLRLLRRALAEFDVAGRVLAADLRPEMSAACQEADLSFATPRATSPDFIPALLDLCARQSIDAIVPTIDTELLVLARHRQAFADIGVKVVVSDARVIELTRDKYVFARHLEEHGLPVPKTWRPANFPRSWDADARFVAKPAGGSSSKGLHFFDGSDIPPEFPPDAIVQERIVGKEFTVNTYVDRTGRILGFAPHERIQVREGEVSKARIVRNPDVEEACADVIRSLDGAYGPMCIQVIHSDTGPKIIELNARFCGGYPLAHRAGLTSANFVVAELLGKSVSPPAKIDDGLLMLRYDDEVFVAAG
jgi:carbamoyl-phosphate synthase large subunit